MRKLMLIIGREYLVRVRTRAFLIFTLLMPLFVGGVVVIPSKLMSRGPSVRRVAVVAADPVLGGAVRAELAASRFSGEEIGAETAESGNQPQFEVSLQGPPTEVLRQQLTAELRRGHLDSVVWIDANATTTRKVTYYSRSVGDFVANALVGRALRMALSQRQLGRARPHARPGQNPFQPGFRGYGARGQAGSQPQQRPGLASAPLCAAVCHLHDGAHLWHLRHALGHRGEILARAGGPAGQRLPHAADGRQNHRRRRRRPHPDRHLVRLRSPAGRRRLCHGPPPVGQNHSGCPHRPGRAHPVPGVFRARLCHLRHASTPRSEPWSTATKRPRSSSFR